MDALFKIPLIIFLLVACIEAYPAENGEMDLPDSSLSKDGSNHETVMAYDPMTVGEGESDKHISLNFTFHFNLPSDWNDLFGKNDGEEGFNSSTTEDDVGFFNILQNPPDLFEGDILEYEPESKSAASDPNKLWPEGKVPYTIDPQLKNQELVIKEAMKHFEDRTCIRFEPRTNQEQYIRIFKGGDGQCYSNIGRSQSGNKLSLGTHCYKPTTIIHELGHAIGLYHEHSRSDRDAYLNIHYRNVKTGKKTNFKTLSPMQNLLLTPFDYDSIMLYGERIFSKNGQKTMTAKDGRKLKNVHHKPGLSRYDIEKINMLYKC